MKVILISGKSGSGKDALAALMRKNLEAQGYNCITIHFADLVKFYAREYYNWDGIKDETGRTLLQHLGTDRVRTYDPNYWAECVARFLAAVTKDFDFAFIPDARFPNEIEITCKYNVDHATIRINRVDEDGNPHVNPLFTAEQLKHPSETSLDTWKWFDYKIINSPGIDKLQNQAKHLVDMITRSE